jgi:hypothetical protein
MENKPYVPFTPLSVKKVNKMTKEERKMYFTKLVEYLRNQK